MYVVLVFWNGGASTAGTPTGWTKIGEASNNTLNCAAYMKYGSASSITVDLNVIGTASAIWYVVDGAVLVSPLIGRGTYVNTTGTGFTMTGVDHLGERGLPIFGFASGISPNWTLNSPYSLNDRTVESGPPDFCEGYGGWGSVVSGTPTNLVASNTNTGGVAGFMFSLRELPPNIPRTPFIGIF
jgi:hypothetical protein